MADNDPSDLTQLPTLLPDTGFLHRKDEHNLILCKPKLMPLKSVTLEKLEKMQKEAEEKLKEQKEQQQS
ncbi:LMBR1 domain-containing protein [Nesidiocoris tenuis]|uniref:LMBR1 domain-containing protein n=1 Tax=Nesidiocoris tenuis TaxID=355587 RepID=A0ABN7ATT9_9HEMI|nr:LMBR1 domain-containing protein [Nesidiocoris tenuis]